MYHSLTVLWLLVTNCHAGSMPFISVLPEGKAGVVFNVVLFALYFCTASFFDRRSSNCVVRAFGVTFSYLFLIAESFVFSKVKTSIFIHSTYPKNIIYIGIWGAYKWSPTPSHICCTKIKCLVFGRVDIPYVGGTTTSLTTSSPTLNFGYITR